MEKMHRVLANRLPDPLLLHLCASGPVFTLPSLSVLSFDSHGLSIFTDSHRLNLLALLDQTQG